MIYNILIIAKILGYNFAKIWKLLQFFWNIESLGPKFLQNVCEILMKLTVPQ